MNGCHSRPLPLEPLLHAYVEGGFPDAAARGARAVAVLSAYETFLETSKRDAMSDGVFQEHLVRFYEACVQPALHTDRVIRRARVIRHALTHLLHGRESMPDKLALCLDVN